MLASTYRILSESAHRLMLAVGLAHPAHPVPGLAEWRRAG